MRGNSGFLRRLSCSVYSFSSTSMGRHTTLIALVTLAVLVPSLHAGPVNARHRRMIREVFSDFADKSMNETQPEGTCLLDGSQVPENSVQCEKKAGCRAIQKTGYCCPDYQCECERDGKIYSNGEKLVDQNTPCTVCYCQGGEILCNNVTCYERNDCEPKYIQGRCCPEYDNCPPLDYVKTSSSKESSVVELKSTPNPPGNNAPPSSTSKPEMVNSNPLGIKIKEITKAEEIRIIDEKPKPVYQIIKPLDSSNLNHPKGIQGKNEQMEHNSQSQDELTFQGENMNPADVKSGETVSTEAVNKLETADVNTINEDSPKTVRHTNPVSNKNESPENPEEVSDEDKNASATQVGEQVVFVDRNGNTKPITVFGAEGLQRGDIASEQLAGIDLDSAASSSTDVKILPITSKSDLSSEGLQADAPAASESSEAFDTVLYTQGPEVVFEAVYHEPVVNATEGPNHSEIDHPPHIDEYDTTSNEPNPAYPVIDEYDDFSRVEKVSSNVEPDDAVEGGRKSNLTMQNDEPAGDDIVEDRTTEGLEIANKSSKLEMTTEGLPESNLTSDSVSERERLSTESPLSHTVEHEEIWPLELDFGSGSGSGAGQLRRDPTIPHHNIPIEPFEDYPSDPHMVIADDPKRHGKGFLGDNNSPFQGSYQKAVGSLHNIRKSFLSIF